MHLCLGQTVIYRSVSSALQADSLFAKKWLIGMGTVHTNSKYKKHYQRKVNLFIFGTDMAK